MLSYSALFIDKKFRRAEAFSGILTNLPKQKLDIIKQLEQKSVTTLVIWEQFFQKEYFRFKTEKLHVYSQFCIMKLI